MAPPPSRKRRRSAATALLSMAAFACVGIATLDAPTSSLWEWRVLLSRSGDGMTAMEEYEEYAEQIEDEMEGEMEALEAVEEEAEVFRRTLMPVLMGEHEYETEDDYDAAARAASEAPDVQRDEVPVQPYTLEDALSESNVFEYTFCVLVYDSPTDKFIALYSKNHKWKAGNKKLWKSVRYLAYMLRKTFPERFTPDAPELALAIGSGDYPHVHKSMLPHAGTAPVLMFGSAFREQGMYSTMLAMPMPEPRHLNCFEEWAARGTVCDVLQAGKGPGGQRPHGEDVHGGLAFGDEEGSGWDELIPQLIWRGTDFSYLPTLQPRPSLVHPDGRKFVRAHPKDDEQRVHAIQSLSEAYDTLLPRWKGVALTAQAELEVADRKDGLPWADIRFSSYLDKGKSPTVGSNKYSLWESVGIAVGKGMSPTELAKYKYHIDLGGGGGTTWSGTVEKLAMEGLLFHHVTPTKDYIHDRIRPWKHYVPVAPDLKDLRQKFDWAESHPEQAKRIADAGTEFMRHLGTPEGFGQMFEEDFVTPLRKVIEAYQPVASVHPEATSWQEVLRSAGEGRVLPVMECTGRSSRYNSCKLVGGDEVLRFQTTGRYEEG
ncbi:hypothetical protein ACHAXT_000027 [Thalassiosira profunda]